MVLEIDDELLHHMGVTEADLRIELFARLFDQGKLSFGRAADMAGVSQDRMEDEIRKRNIPRYRYTEEDFERDCRTLAKLEAEGFFKKRA